MTPIDSSEEGPPPAAPYGAPSTTAQTPPPGAPPSGSPAPGRKPLLRRWWVWLVAAIALVVVISAIAGAASSGSGSPSAEGAPQSTAGDEPHDGAEETAETEEVPDVEEAADVPGIGETAVIDGFEITVTSIETGLPSVGNEYVSEEAQGAFALLSVEVSNTGASAETVLSSSFTVLDGVGREFEAHSTASIYLEDRGFAFEKINPGNTATGVLVFDLPPDAVPQTLEFAPGFFGGTAVAIDLA